MPAKASQIDALGQEKRAPDRRQMRGVIAAGQQPVNEHRVPIRRGIAQVVANLHHRRGAAGQIQIDPPQQLFVGRRRAAGVTLFSRQSRSSRASISATAASSGLAASMGTQEAGGATQSGGTVPVIFPRLHNAFHGVLMANSCSSMPRRGTLKARRRPQRPRSASRRETMRDPLIERGLRVGQNARRMCPADCSQDSFSADAFVDRRRA